MWLEAPSLCSAYPKLHTATGRGVYSIIIILSEGGSISGKQNLLEFHKKNIEDKNEGKAD